MTKLVSRASIKNLLNIPLADLLEDPTLDKLINHHSDLVAKLCRRDFAEKARIEFYQSYDQPSYDPDYQYIWLNGPVDVGETFAISWARGMKHSTEGIDLTTDHYYLDTEKDLVLIKPNTTYEYCWDPKGFRITYTGGYPVTFEPGGHTDDPTDDWDVIQCPTDLAQLVSDKVLKDYRLIKDSKMVLVPSTWTPEERQALLPWNKKDVI